MNRLLTIATALLLALTAPAHAHRLDEYLQATILSIQGTHVEGFMRLVPGVAVSSIVISSIDTNGDGTLSEPEQQVYALRVLGDLSLSIDGRPAALHLGSAHFPSLDEMREGMGEIRLDFTADLPRGGLNRKLVFENHHQSRISAYLVNSLVPSDKTFRITAQNRNQNQSLYQLDFAQADGGAGLPPAPHASLPRLSGFEGAFRLGARHIAEGTDHLLFLMVLLLPAPLLACGARWAQCATIRGSLLQITKIVTAFTLGHSVTLALAALGWVHMPSRPIEVLIAVSILVSALHAMHPLFPGREAAIAAFFGLIHGLAFATAVRDLGFDRWYRLVSILGFNLGIETMQLIVVAAILPSLLLLSRTRAYSLLRIGAALFAILASMGWIGERLLNMQNSLDSVVEIAAHHAPWIAAAIFLVSVLLYSQPTRRVQWSEVSPHD